MYVQHAHLFHGSSKRQFDKLCRLLIGTQYDTCGKTSYFCMQVVENRAVIFQGIASLLLLTEAQCGSKMQFKGCPPPPPPHPSGTGQQGCRGMAHTMEVSVWTHNSVPTCNEHVPNTIHLCAIVPCTPEEDETSSGV